MEATAQTRSPFAMQTQNHAAGFKRRPDDDMVGDVNDSALGADESAVTDPAEILGAASPQSQEIEILRTLRQLRHDYELLLREKRELEDYCEDVERDAQHKDDLVVAMRSDHDAIKALHSRAADTAQHELAELRAELADAQKRHRRSTHLARNDSGIGGSKGTLCTAASTTEELQAELAKLDTSLGSVAGFLRAKASAGDDGATAALTSAAHQLVHEPGTAGAGPSKAELAAAVASLEEELAGAAAEIDGAREQADQWEQLTNALEEELESVQTVLGTEQEERQRLQDVVDELQTLLHAAEARAQQSLCAVVEATAHATEADARATAAEAAQPAAAAVRLVRPQQAPSMPLTPRIVSEDSLAAEFAASSSFSADSGLEAGSEPGSPLVIGSLAAELSARESLAAAVTADVETSLADEAHAEPAPAEPEPKPEAAQAVPAPAPKKRLTLMVPPNLNDLISTAKPALMSHAWSATAMDADGLDLGANLNDISLFSVGSPMARSTPAPDEGAAVDAAAAAAAVDAPAFAEGRRGGENLAIALYNFNAQNIQRELSINIGEELVVLRGVPSEEWWLVQNRASATGYVPRNYVQANDDELRTAVNVLQRKNKAGSADKGPSQTLGAAAANLAASKAESTEWTARFAYTAAKEAELSFMKGAVLKVLECPGGKQWWKAEDATGAVGFVPVTYIKPAGKRGSAGRTDSAGSGAGDSGAGVGSGAAGGGSLRATTTLPAGKSPGRPARSIDELEIDKAAAELAAVAATAEGRGKRGSLFGSVGSRVGQRVAASKFYNNMPSKSQVWERMQSTKEKLTQQRIALQQAGGGGGGSSSKPKPKAAKVSSWFKSRLGGPKPGPVVLPQGMFRAVAQDGGQEAQPEPAPRPGPRANELQEGADDWMAMAMQQAQRRQGVDWRQPVAGDDGGDDTPATVVALPPPPPDATMPKALKLLGLNRAARSAPGAQLAAAAVQPRPIGLRPNNY